MLNLKKEKGQSLVEFALVLPILLTLVFSIIDFGMLFSTKNQLETTSFAMARQISLGTPAPLGVTVTDPTTGSLLSSYAVGQQVKVTVTTNYTALTPIVGIFFGNNIVPLSSATSVMIEQLAHS